VIGMKAGVVPEIRSTRTTMKTKSLLTSLAILIAVLPQARAVLIAYDGFSTPGTYTDGTTILTPGNGGSGWTDNWTVSGTPTGQFTGTTSGLTYSNGGALTTTAGAAIDTSTTNTTQMMRHFSSTDYVNGDSIYLSFLVNRSAALSTSLLEFRLINKSGDSTRAIFRSSSSSADSWTLADASNNVFGTAGSSVVGNTFFAVMRVDFLTGNTGVSLWLNPALNTPLGAANISGGLGSSSFDIGGVRLTAQASATGTFDEVRVGTTYADVSPIPEPTTWALLAGSLTVLVVFRRRRS